MLQFCIDFRRLNARTKKDAYPLPRMQETMESMVGARHFSCMNLKSGFWQVKMDKESRQYTAFTVGIMGIYKFLRMPYGLCNEKRNFKVDGLMALIQHASIRLKNKIYGRKEDQTAVLMLDPTEAQPLPLPFIPSIANYTLHSKPVLPAMRRNYIKDRAQAAVTYITEYGNTTLWSLETWYPCTN